MVRFSSSSSSTSTGTSHSAITTSSLTTTSSTVFVWIHSILVHGLIPFLILYMSSIHSCTLFLLCLRNTSITILSHFFLLLIVVGVSYLLFSRTTGNLQLEGEEDNYPGKNYHYDHRKVGQRISLFIANIPKYLCFWKHNDKILHYPHHHRTNSSNLSSSRSSILLLDIVPCGLYLLGSVWITLVYGSLTNWILLYSPSIDTTTSTASKVIWLIILVYYTVGILTYNRLFFILYNYFWNQFTKDTNNDGVVPVLPLPSPRTSTVKSSRFFEDLGNYILFQQQQWWYYPVSSNHHNPPSHPRSPTPVLYQSPSSSSSSGSILPTPFHENRFTTFNVIIRSVIGTGIYSLMLSYLLIQGNVGIYGSSLTLGNDVFVFYLFEFLFRILPLFIILVMLMMKGINVCSNVCSSRIVPLFSSSSYSAIDHQE